MKPNVAIGLLLLLATVGVGYLAVTIPSGFRSEGTGYPTSGPLGWLTAILGTATLFFFFAGDEKEDKK